MDAEVEAKKAPDAALIAGIVAGVVSAFMLAFILVYLWKTRKSANNRGLPLTRTNSVYRSKTMVSSSTSASTTQMGSPSRMLRDTGRIGTISSSVSAADDTGALARIGLGPPVEQSSSSKERGPLY